SRGAGLPQIPDPGAEELAIAELFIFLDRTPNRVAALDPPRPADRHVGPFGLSPDSYSDPFHQEADDLLPFLDRGGRGLPPAGGRGRPPPGSSGPEPVPPPLPARAAPSGFAPPAAPVPGPPSDSPGRRHDSAGRPGRPGFERVPAAGASAGPVAVAPAGDRPGSARATPTAPARSPATLRLPPGPRAGCPPDSGRPARPAGHIP